MNITVDKQPNCLAVYTAEVPVDAVESARKDIMKAYAKEAKIPGFRPGKAPAKLIQKRYAKEIDEELQSRMVRTTTEKAIQQEDLRALEVQMPETFEIKEDGSLTIKSTIILAPSIELPEYKGLEIEAESDEITEEDETNAIEQLRERHADYTDIDDRPIKADDIAVITYSSTLDGKTLEEAVGKPVGFIAGREGFWIKVTDGAFLPGFSKEVEGMATGETKEITINMPEDFPVEDLRGKDVVFATTLDGIKEQTLPELNDEFAAKLAEGKTLDEVKEMLSDNIKQQKGNHVQEQKVQMLLSALTEKVDFELPQSVVDREAQNAADQMVNNAMQQGATEEQLKEQEAQILESAQAQAKQNLKVNFLMQEIAQKEEIKVEQQDVLQRIMQMAQQAGKKPDAFIKELQKENQIPAVQNQVLVGKTIDFLLSEANITIVDPKKDSE